MANLFFFGFLIIACNWQLSATVVISLEANCMARTNQNGRESVADFVTKTSTRDLAIGCETQTPSSLARTQASIMGSLTTDLFSILLSADLYIRTFTSSFPPILDSSCYGVNGVACWADGNLSGEAIILLATEGAPRQGYLRYYYNSSYSPTAIGYTTASATFDSTPLFSHFSFDRPGYLPIQLGSEHSLDISFWAKEGTYNSIAWQQGTVRGAFSFVESDRTTPVAFYSIDALTDPFAVPEVSTVGLVGAPIFLIFSTKLRRILMMK